MAEKKSYKPVSPEQIEILKANRCTADDFNSIEVTDAFDPANVVNVTFSGKVSIGDTTGTVTNLAGIEKPCGIYNATVIDSSVGDNTRIANIAVQIANYNIADNVCIENVASMQTNPGAAFGNGVEIEVLNEAGGREVTLFNDLNAQFAYLLCLHRYRPKMIDKLNSFVKEYVAKVKSDRGTVAAGAKIASVTEIVDVNIGSCATINAPASMVNGTVLSASDAPTHVGPKVVAKDFIFQESASVDGGAFIVKTLIGQGTQVGKQYSAENSLFFANSEAFHGEACSVFGGPYTVTHHKSSLLIAGLFSFYNAGSGSNQSNHMYKLGPCHEGKLQRGCKTGSFSYMMWPCMIGPFGVVLGKHTTNFDTSDYPFSHHEARADGKCAMIPGLHLTTVGTVRDGAKWPNRDRRKGSLKRDLISFDVFSPYTVGKMISASTKLNDIHAGTDKSIEEVSVGGAMVRRPILRTGQKFYRTGIEMYLLDKVVEKIQDALKAGPFKPAEAFAPAIGAVYSSRWMDICGLLMPEDRLKALHDEIENGKINNTSEFFSAIAKIDDAYAIDEWSWIYNTVKEYFQIDLCSATNNQLIEMAQNFQKVRTKFLNLVIADAQKEFDQLSRIGFGRDGSENDVDEDFEQVRGIYEENKFVKEMKQNVADLQQKIADIEKLLNKCL